MLAILWFQFVGIYVDWLWFGEVGFREVFTTQAISRIVLFLSPALGGGGLVFLSLSSPTGPGRSSCRPNEVDPLAPVPDDRHAPARSSSPSASPAWSG